MKERGEVVAIDTKRRHLMKQIASELQLRHATQISPHAEVPLEVTSANASIDQGNPQVAGRVVVSASGS